MALSSTVVIITIVSIYAYMDIITELTNDVFGSFERSIGTIVDIVRLYSRKRQATKVEVQHPTITDGSYGMFVSPKRPRKRRLPQQTRTKLRFDSGGQTCPTAFSFSGCPCVCWWLRRVSRARRVGDETSVSRQSPS